MRIPLLAIALVAAPSPAEASLWGYGGLVTMPDASTAKAREIEAGANLVSFPLQPLAIAGFARYGILEGLEASLLFGVPGYRALTGSVKYQLLRPTPANPLAVTVGATLLGVPALGAIPGTGYFVAISRDLPLGALHLGFSGDLALNSRLLAGLEVPLGSWGRGMLEGRGPQPGSGGFANLGIELFPFSWLRLKAASLGSPDSTERGFFAGASLRAMLPDWSVPSPSLQSGRVSPPPLPSAILIGRVLGPEGTPRAGYEVMAAERRATTTPNGYFFLSGLSPGTYPLIVKDPAGKTVATFSAEIKGAGPTTLTLPLGS